LYGNYGNQPPNQPPNYGGGQPPYGGQPNYGNQPNMYGYQQAKQKRTGRRVLITVIVILVALVALDFGAKAFAENEAAVQIQKQGFPTKPSIAIAGFPFLTQVISRHFDQITISSGSFPAGPITVSKLNVVATNVHLASNFKSGTAGPLNGTVLIGLGAIGHALSVAGPIVGFLGGGSQGLKVVSVGSNEIKANLHLAGGIVNASATWKVMSAGPNHLRLHLVSSSGEVPSGLLSKANNILIPLSQLPAGLRLTGGINSSSNGISAHVFARSISFGG
jgi:LmeA-like phospholipid-binding